MVGGEKNFDNYTNPDDDPNGDWCSGDPSAKSGSSATYFEIVNPVTGKIDFPPQGRYWGFSKDTLKEYIATGKIKFREELVDNQRGFIFKRYRNELKRQHNPVNSLFANSNEYMNQAATKELAQMFNNSYFTYPKPTELIKNFIKSSSKNNDAILDFFSGSATTTHAVMKLNVEDGGNRKFIMVQVPEPIDLKNNKEAYNFCIENNLETNICSIGQERIKRASDQIKEDSNANIDYGFRVFKVDSSNMKDIYFKPHEFIQEQLFELESNIKEDRSSRDLLTSVILDLGLTLDLTIESKFIMNHEVFYVAENTLVACFDPNFNIDLINELCLINPLKLVFRESCFRTDNDKINVAERIKKLSPNTEVHVL